ncbi:TonB-dependent receptor [Chitinophaga caseinilytica]|uniref:TonB-dependent receptor n=1 Tax=Chitinophaga caseinilytica TaxID=2267521 RepID=A0ABZ2Z034_9BACT
MSWIPGYTQQSTSKKITVTGTVQDSTGMLLPGISIGVMGSQGVGTSTDMNGKFVLDVPADGALQVSAIGYVPQTIQVKGRAVIDIVLEIATSKLQDVVVTAFGRKQRREATVGSVTSINPQQLKIPSSNLTTALAGQLAGIVAYQRSGQPGADNANFFIRGVTTFGYKNDPLILVDNVELTATDLARLQVDDIASFSILKDASATALYGARGANGVILVTTKEGKEGKAMINFRLENKISQPTKEISLADPFTYMRLYNEANYNSGILEPRYNEKEIRMRQDPNRNPYVYPVVDWMKEITRRSTFNQSGNFSVSGGGKVARYYISGAANRDNGTLKVDKMNSFNSNAKLNNYQLRSNVNVNITKTTEAVVRLSGNFDEYTGPIAPAGSIATDMYYQVLHTSPVDFPAYYAPDSANQTTRHILFGGTPEYGYTNPYASIMKGYQNFSQSRMSAQFEVTQKLPFVTEGLTFRGLISTNRFSFFDVVRQYKPFYYYVDPVTGYDKLTDKYTLTWLNPDPGAATEYIDYVATPGNRKISSFLYMQGVLDYDRQFGASNVSGSLVATRQQTLNAQATDLQSSLPFRNIGLAGRATYAYKSRYFAEFNFGYNGSERFAEKNRFGFFPTFGVSWVPSNEEFWRNGGISDFVQRMKIRASYGLVGNDAIAGTRFYYLSNLNLNGGNSSVFGINNNYVRNGVRILSYENNDVTWEVARTTNIAVELEMFRGFNITAEIYRQQRDRILQARSAIPTSMGLEATVSANLGKAEARGLDLQADYKRNFAGEKGWVQARGNFTFAQNEYVAYEEPMWDEPWRRAVGKKLNQAKGFIAERLFVDDKEVAASPVQNFNGVPTRGGDIKYRDLNGDGVITERDETYIGYPTTPEIVYGFGLSAGYKAFDISVFFQGVDRVSFFIDPNATAPFVGNTQLLKAYADDHWSEENQDLMATWPRLTANANPNNTFRPSTWFMRNGAFLRLKSVELGYTLPKRIAKKAYMENCRIYASGLNLLTWSAFKMWDPELAGSGMNYPVQRVFNLALNVNF